MDFIYPGTKYIMTASDEKRLLYPVAADSAVPGRADAAQLRTEFPTVKVKNALPLVSPPPVPQGRSGSRSGRASGASGLPSRPLALVVSLFIWYMPPTSGAQPGCAPPHPLRPPPGTRVLPNPAGGMWGPLGALRGRQHGPWASGCAR
jgi:hypothetical protein